MPNTNTTESIDLDNTSSEPNSLIISSHTSPGSNTKDGTNSGSALVSPDQPNLNNTDNQVNPNRIVAIV